MHTPQAHLIPQVHTHTHTRVVAVGGRKDKGPYSVKERKRYLVFVLTSLSSIPLLSWVCMCVDVHWIEALLELF